MTITIPCALGEQVQAGTAASAATIAPSSWQEGYRSRFSSVQVNSQQVSQLLGPAFSYNFTLPEEQLRKGVAYIGSNHRLRRVMRDMVSGKRAVRIAHVCGTASSEAGPAQRGDMHWFSVLSRYLTMAFPQANITTRAGGCMAGPTEEPDADIIFLEYVDGFVDQLWNNPQVKQVEGLVRQVLGLTKQPAAIMMQTMPRGAGVEPNQPGWKPFPHTVEDLHNAIAQYYDVQALSLRTALYRLTTFKQQQGYRWADFMSADGSSMGPGGHKAMADLAVWLLQQTAIDLSMRPWGRADKELMGEQLPVPIYKP